MAQTKLELQEQNAKSKSPNSHSMLYVAFFLAIFVTIIGVLYLTNDIIPGPEYAILILSIYAVYSKKTWQFLKDWIPFLMVFVSYETLNGLVGTVSKFNIHYGPYNVDIALFGGNDPNLVLQHYLRTPILNFTGAFFYTIYFFVPTAFGFVFWLKYRKEFWKYTVSLAVLVYSSLVTFLAYPVAPPWLNTALTNKGLTRILSSSVDKSLGVPAYKTLYDFMGPNLYAAFPSLHSALPWLVFLFALKIWKRKALPILVLPIGTWFSAVYLGEHYFTDVLGGIAYATIAFVAVETLIPLILNRSKFFEKQR
ncbi:MAG: phosphatase PAP2 family protein [Candidatus Bathyarchaeia archaeon]|jgi:membrane-associated phospholipid phosphatase